jgi:rhamnogalacturonan endolyase
MDYLSRGLRALTRRAAGEPATLRRSHDGRRLALESLEPRAMMAVATLSPVADAYSTGGAGAGTATVLQVQDNNGNDAIAYFRFDLAALNINAITSATLTFSKVGSVRNDTINTGRFRNYGLTNTAGNTAQNWNETALATGGLGAEYTSVSGNLLDFARVANLDADNGANVVETVNNAVAPQSLSGADLVTFLNSRVADGGLATLISLVDAGTSIRGWGYASRENADTSLRPTLQITYEEGDPDPDPNPTTLRQVELLDRGVVAIRRSTTQAYIGWRLLGTDPTGIAFNVYRAAGAGAPVKLNAAPLTTTTDFVDSTANFAVSNTYHVRAVINGVEQPAIKSFALAANATVGYYLEVPLQVPVGGTTPSGEAYTYTANDASVGDLDGDGEYEIILKWEPTNAKDNAHSGYTGNVYIDAYKLNGTQLWRIDLGRNIRAGAHYTQFIVYDLDGDGRAEVSLKTAPGTVDGVGNFVLMGSDSATADYRNGSGYILAGPEYLTVFNGQTGANMATVAYQPARGSVSQWGDSYGNRVDRFAGAVAYLDGERPSLVMSRGYYGPQSSGGSARNEIAAYDFRNGQLTLRWHFKAQRNINGANLNLDYVGQGTHGISVADVDGDGKDEIVYGASVINDNGTGLYTTGWGHGDALHVSDMDPTRPGLEVFMPHEGTGGNGNVAASYRDAATGEMLANLPLAVQYTDANGNLQWPDVGRGVAADIDPTNPGFELWDSYHPDIYDVHGNALYAKPSNMFNNFLVWWDADLTRELLNGTTISEWNNPGRSNFDLDPAVSGTQSAPGVTSVNGTKSTPSVSADLFGDWREEVVWPTTDSTRLRIFTTPIAATSRMVTLMHDTQYRVAIAWQNAAYNQPPHPSFYLGAGMSAPPAPAIYAAINGDFDGSGTVDGADLAVWRTNAGQSVEFGQSVGDADGDRNTNGFDFLVWQRNLGKSAPLPATTATVAAAVVAADEALLTALAPEDSQVIIDASIGALAASGLPGETPRPTQASARPSFRPTIVLATITETVSGIDEVLHGDSMLSGGERTDPEVTPDKRSSNSLADALDAAFAGL